MIHHKEIKKRLYSMGMNFEKLADICSTTRHAAEKAYKKGFDFSCIGHQKIAELLSYDNELTDYEFLKKRTRMGIFIFKR